MSEHTFLDRLKKHLTDRDMPIPSLDGLGASARDAGRRAAAAVTAARETVTERLTEVAGGATTASTDAGDRLDELMNRLRGDAAPGRTSAPTDHPDIIDGEVIDEKDL